MSKIAAYLLSIGAAGILSSVVKRVIGDKAVSGKIIKMVTGVFLVITVLTPIMDFSFRDIPLYLEDYKIAADGIVADGINAAREEQKIIIKQQTEAYILDEAGRMGANIGVSVCLSETETPYPTGVEIRGNLSPYMKAQFSDWLTRSLNISKENIQWT